MVRFNLEDIKYFMSEIGLARWTGYCLDRENTFEREAKLSDFTDKSIILYVADHLGGYYHEFIINNEKFVSITGRKILDYSEQWCEYLDKTYKTEDNIKTI